MTELEYKLILRFLYARLIGTVTLSSLIAGILYFLVENLGDVTNDSLTTLLGITMGFLGTALAIIAAALSRDILEHIERMRRRENADD